MRFRNAKASVPPGVGHGVALPHARLSSLTTVHGAFLRLEKPVDFDAADRQPVDLVFALFAPTDTGVDHLKALALVSRTLRDQTLCTKLGPTAIPRRSTRSSPKAARPRPLRRRTLRHADWENRTARNPCGRRRTSPFADRVIR
jgi:hypothetical protein